jgi:hypothetical protein
MIIFGVGQRDHETAARKHTRISQGAAQRRRVPAGADRATGQDGAKRSEAARQRDYGGRTAGFTLGNGGNGMAGAAKRCQQKKKLLWKEITGRYIRPVCSF